MHRILEERRRIEENGLVRQMAAARISNLEEHDIRAQRGDPNAPGLLDMPPLPLKMIFSLVASRSFNKSPMLHEPENPHFTERIERAFDEYSVKNLMSLRRVCTKFDDIINNMSPIIDFEPIDINVKLKGCDNSRTVIFYKYNGTGSRQPATRLSRIRRFNEFKEHVEHFERIRLLYINNIPLTEELFDTLRQLDLKNLTLICFEKIPAVKFAEGTDVPAYIKQFMDSIDPETRTVFLSEVFDPQKVLFGQKQEEQMEFEFMPDVSITSRHYKKIRLRKKAKSLDIRPRMARSINLINETMIGGPVLRCKPGWTEVAEAFGASITMLIDVVKQKIELKSGTLGKCGRFHLRKLIKLLHKDRVPPRRSFLFHLKMLKKITGMDPLLSDEEKRIVDYLEDERARQQFIQQFPSLQKWPKTRRLYVGDVRV